MVPEGRRQKTRLRLRASDFVPIDDIGTTPDKTPGQAEGREMRTEVKR
jgi:hypothetical protein